MNKEMSQWNEEQQGITHTQKFELRIKFDMGGNRYSTHDINHNDISPFPESMIRVMFFGRHPLTLDDEGCYFIDLVTTPISTHSELSEGP